MASCECGCGAEAKEGKRFLPAHHLRKEYLDAHKPKVNKVVGKLERIISMKEMLNAVGEPAATNQEPARRVEPSEDEIEVAAQLLLDFIAKRDPTWGDRIRIGREEKAWSARQFAFAMIGWMLDRAYHLEAPSHPALEPGSHRYGEHECPECHKKFIAKIPGQKFDTNECGMKSDQRRDAAEKAERKAKEQAAQTRGAHNRG